MFKSKDTLNNKYSDHYDYIITMGNDQMLLQIYLYLGSKNDELIIFSLENLIFKNSFNVLIMVLQVWYFSLKLKK